MTSSYHGHRLPAEIIRYCMWQYHMFSLRFRDIEKMMLYRDIVVTCEVIENNP